MNTRSQNTDNPPGSELNPDIGSAEIVKKTLLVAEDVEADFLLIQSLLGKSYHLIHAWNGIEAVTLFEKSKPDLVLMDLKMPKMNGLDATTLIRNMDEEVPVVMVSTRAYEIDRDAAEKVGCTDFVNKPLSKKSLEEVLSKYLEKPECAMNINPADYRILAVDDLKGDLILLQTILQSVGFMVDTADSGLMALSMVEKSKPDLILLNVTMPGMSGYETLEKLRSNPKFLQIPVLFFTAKSDPDSLVKAFNKGASDFIRKPFVQAELISRVNYQLSLLNAQRLLSKQNHELQHTVKSRDRMYSIMSRDLRAPVASIGMLTSTLAALMEKETVSSEFKNFVFSVNKVASDVFSLLDNLLKWNQLQLKKIQPQKQRIGLCDLLNSVLDTYVPLAAQKGIELKINHEEKISQSLKLSDLEVDVDVEMFKSMLKNLIANAIKYSEKGSEILVGAILEGELLKIYVKDHGKGMSIEEQGKLFKPNFRYSASGTRQENGYGLGLMLCKEFIELHGGHIEMESEENKGSTFYLAIPVN
jgi:two-component system sensor histidine kinase/response regulator